MKNKKLILNITAVLGLWILGTGSALATTWYVRDGGGNYGTTSTTCNGHTNAVFTGSNGPNCALNHPSWVIGTVNVDPLWSGGDTLNIDGDSDLNPGQQAKYLIGYGMPNTTNSGCPSWGTWECGLQTLPAGSSTTAQTHIIGTGSHYAQLYAHGGVGLVLDAENGYIDLENLEITTDANCLYSGPVGPNGATTNPDGFPYLCPYTGGPGPYYSGKTGIQVGGTGETLTNVLVHGLYNGMNNGVNGGVVGNITFTNVKIFGNSAEGISIGQGQAVDNVMTGTLTFQDSQIDFNGCGQRLPLKDSADIYKNIGTSGLSTSVDNEANYYNCFGQDQNGYGDGVAFGPNGSANAGNWNIIHSSISFNTQDGLDTLHGNGNGTIAVIRSRMEGNAGQQVKLNGKTEIVENSLINGDCARWLGAPESSTTMGSAGGDATGFHITGGAVCRAEGDVAIFILSSGAQVYFYNNTINANGIAIGSVGGGCDSTSGVHIYNNIINGGVYAAYDSAISGSQDNDQLTPYTYLGGSDGDGTGSCGPVGNGSGGVMKIDEDYNLVYNTKNNNAGCNGAHDKCGVAPGFSSSIPMGTLDGGANTFYHGTAMSTLETLSSSSPAIKAGVAGLTYVNGSTDYNGAAQNNPPDLGGMEYNGVILSGLPVVSITSPSSGSTIASGSNVTFTATASEAGGTISSVSFYNGTTLLGTDTSAPYNYTATNISTGIYTLTAVATDAKGISTTSSAVTLTINLPVTSSTPVVTITGPGSGSTYTSGTNVTIAASASETNGTISKISIYNGSGVLLGSSSTSPFNYVYTGILAGNYTFYAVATDANGVSTTSSPITVTVNGLPAVTITSPGNGSTFTAGSNIPVTTTASEANGSISNISLYYNGTNLLGSSSTSPFNYTGTNVGAGAYTLTAVATDANGISTTSAPINITVTSVSAGVPSITAQPTSVTVTAPATATFTVTANGTPAYQWMQSINGGSYTNIGGATSASYTTPATTTANNGTKFECVVSNSSGSVTSNAATLTVSSGLPVVAITTPVNGGTILQGSTFIISANASEVNGTITQVQFYTDTTLLGTVTSAPYSISWVNSTRPSYSLTAVATDTNGHSTTSSIVNITVTSSSVAPSITTQPNNVTVTAPATATFSVAATGTPAPTYQWMQSVNDGSYTNISGATSASYTTPSTTTANSGTIFKCVVSNASSSVTSNAVTLTVNPTPTAPSISTQPNSATVTAPATATFTVAATGTPAPTYQWMESVNGGTFTNISGATSSSYTTPATTTVNNGTTFECVVSNASGSVTSNAATLTVNPTPLTPNITDQPDNVTVTAPATATFTVAATGTPAPTYQWMQSINGSTYTNISGATSTSYTTPATSTANSGTKFKCMVTNASGSVTSSVATLTVNPTPLTPSITDQPDNVTVTAPTTAVFTVAATGTPAPTYQWMQSVNGSSYVNISGATGNSYTTPATTMANSGTKFKCMIANSVGSVMSNAAILTVTPTPVAPSITDQPDNVTVTAPATATFTVAAKGTPAPTYQWMQSVNGGVYTNIGGAINSSYTTPATSTANSGTKFKCMVTNASGSVTSSVATLTVNPTPLTPSITDQPDNVTVTAPATATFTVAATGTPAPTYQWMQSINGGVYTNINGAFSTSYTTPSTTTANSGTTFECVVSNASGSVTSNAATLTVNSQASKPVVTLTSPTTGSNFTGGSNVTLTATATEANGTINKVVFFYNGNQLGAGTANGSTYSYTITGIGMGNYIFSAVATDANGVSTTSNVANVTVTAPPLPVVSMTTPTSGSSIASGSNVTLTATATEANGTISNVIFFYNGKQLGVGTANGSTYSYTITGIGGGNYSFLAVATDANGNSTTSSAVAMTVTVPAVTMTSPSNGSSVSGGSNVTLTATAAQANGSISKVVFFYNGKQLGTGTANGSTYSYTMTGIGIGNYIFSAIATNTNGISTTSNAVTVTVTPVAPVIAAQPADSTVTASATATFTVAATGAPVPSYQWMQSVNGDAYTPISGATGASYTTPTTNLSDSGTTFECVISNAAGSITSNAVTLIVTPMPVAPMIINQPSDVAVATPTAATFTVSAIGTPAPSYQWMQSVDGGAYINIPGATSDSYTTPSTSTADSGTTFKCVVTNSAGSVTSSAATLTANKVQIRLF